MTPALRLCAFILGISLAAPGVWATSAAPASPAYTIQPVTLAYAAPFLITDLREDGALPFIYSNKESYDIHRLTVYRPALDGTPLENRPVVFFVHGGGWTSGYRDWYETVAQSFTGEKGWVTVVIDYRLTSDQVFVADQYCPDRATCALPENIVQRTKAAEYPANSADVATAFEWVTQHIGEHGGDPRQIIAFGHSAGAHLATLMTVSDAYANLRGAIRGLVAMSGAYNLDDLGFRMVYYDVLGQTFGLPLDRTELRGASPVTHLSPGRSYPPLYLLYAEDELPQFAAQTNAMTATLTANHIPYALDYLAGYSHNSEMAAIPFIQETPTTLIVRFIERILMRPSYLPLVIR